MDDDGPIGLRLGRHGVHGFVDEVLAATRTHAVHSADHHLPHLVGLRSEVDNRVLLGPDVLVPPPGTELDVDAGAEGTVASGPDDGDVVGDIELDLLIGPRNRLLFPTPTCGFAVGLEHGSVRAQSSISVIARSGQLFAPVRASASRPAGTTVSSIRL